MSTGEIVLRTARLVLTSISASDFAAARAIASDARVMACLGGAQSDAECRAWLERQLAHWRAHGFGRFRVDAGDRCVGFAGLRDCDHPPGPGVELAWRLAFDEWGKGYATEAARVCIEHGFSELGLREVVAVTTIGNARSRAVMTRLGMQHVPEQTYDHPELSEGDPLRTHVVYRLRAS